MRALSRTFGSRARAGVLVVSPTCCQIHHSAPALRPARSLVALDLPSPPAPTTEGITYEPLPRSIKPTSGLLLLSIPIPPSKWPARLEMISPLLAATSKAVKPYNIMVNMVYDNTGDASFPADPTDETYLARLSFSDGKTVDFAQFGMETLTSERFLKSLEYRAKKPTLTGKTEGPWEVYVCTHGSRDCRCSHRGTPLVRALRDEVQARGFGESVRIGEITHVGGHKFAANAVVLPSLDMFSNLSAGNASGLLDHLANPAAGSPMWKHWRGRFGLSEDQQASIWKVVDPEANGAEGPKGEAIKANEPVVMRFKTWEGEVREVKADLGETLLQMAKKYDLPSMEGTCGGNLECATCHCYLPRSPPPPVPEPTEAEQDMLGYAVGYRDGESRLGCQIKVTPELVKWVQEGGVIGLPRF